MTADPTPPSADLSKEALDALETDLRRKVTLGTGVVTPLRIQAADAIAALRRETRAQGMRKAWPVVRAVICRQDWAGTDGDALCDAIRDAILAAAEKESGHD